MKTHPAAQKDQGRLPDRPSRTGHGPSEHRACAGCPWSGVRRLEAGVLLRASMAPRVKATAGCGEERRLHWGLGEEGACVDSPGGASKQEGFERKRGGPRIPSLARRNRAEGLFAGDVWLL